MATTSIIGKQIQNGTNKPAVYHQNGIREAVVNTSKTSYTQYCPRCGKPKSSHRFMQGCPK
jgi:hypothetical protein